MWSVFLYSAVDLISPTPHFTFKSATPSCFPHSFDFTHSLKAARAVKHTLLPMCVCVKGNNASPILILVYRTCWRCITSCMLLSARKECWCYSSIQKETGKTRFQSGNKAQGSIKQGQEVNRLFFRDKNPSYEQTLPCTSVFNIQKPWWSKFCETLSTNVELSDHEKNVWPQRNSDWLID